MFSDEELPIGSAILVLAILLVSSVVFLEESLVEIPSRSGSPDQAVYVLIKTAAVPQTCFN